MLETRSEMTQHSGEREAGRGQGKADKSDFTFTISEKGIKLNVVCVLGDAIGLTHVKTAKYRYMVHSPRWRRMRPRTLRSRRPEQVYQRYLPWPQPVSV